MARAPSAPDGLSSGDDVDGARCAPASRPWVLAATILASAMAFIDGSVVGIALPVLQRELGAGFVLVQWVVSGYTLFLAALLLVGGAAGDRFGRRRVFMAGILLFAAASLACAVAPGIRSLIAARTLQGIGAALLVPQSLAILSAAFPPEIRGRAIGTWAGAASITTALGPAVGGFLIDGLGWRAAFWINLPLAALAIGLTLRHVPETRSEAAGPLDWRGAALAVLASALLTAGLTGLAEPGWRLAAAGALLAGALAAAAFIRTERRAAAPLVPLGLFADRAFVGANLLTLALYGALSGILFLLPFELIGRRAMSPGEVGLVLLPLGLIIGVGARPAGDLADRHGARPFLAAGSTLVAVSAAWLMLSPPGLVAGVLAPVALLGFGMALVVAPVTTAVMSAAPDSAAGAASGISNAASRFAGLFAIALVTALAASVFAASGGAGGRFGVFPPAGDPAAGTVADAFARGWIVAMAANALLAAAGAITAWRMLPAKDAARS
ncbi:MAG: MFS transporter [Rhodovulum sulfidophilum]|uniref:MFS transporter n=1 Tax=Rhodovulum sulfidophilum TaxID=35806 RepID=A0A2W5N1L8_RHOSU|nr:MAG: MFS transporter [Rhodovulum sulfidophilum]